MEPGPGATQPSVIRRSAHLLRLLAAREPEGATTTHLATTAAIPRPTAHRLLSALQEEGLVERDNDTGTWHLGPECFLLGAAATTRHDITPAARAAVLRIARETGRAPSSRSGAVTRRSAYCVRTAASRSAPTCSTKASGSRSASPRPAW